jgi:hypothetical protein
VVWHHIDVPWWGWDIYVIACWLTGKQLGRVLLRRRTQGGHQVTIVSGLRCFHCKTDVYPMEGVVTKCTCGRIKMKPNGTASSDVGTKISRIVPDKR